MITLTITTIVCFIISSYKINKKSKNLNIPFNPFEVGFVYTITFFMSFIFLFGAFLFTCFTGILP